MEKGKMYLIKDRETNSVILFELLEKTNKCYRFTDVESYKYYGEGYGQWILIDEFDKRFEMIEEYVNNEYDNCNCECDCEKEPSIEETWDLFTKKVISKIIDQKDKYKDTIDENITKLHNVIDDFSKSIKENYKKKEE